MSFVVVVPTFFPGVIFPTIGLFVIHTHTHAHTQTQGNTAGWDSLHPGGRSRKDSWACENGFVPLFLAVVMEIRSLCTGRWRKKNVKIGISLSFTIGRTNETGETQGSPTFTKML